MISSQTSFIEITFKNGSQIIPIKEGTVTLDDSNNLTICSTDGIVMSFRADEHTTIEYEYGYEVYHYGDITITISEEMDY